MGSKIRVLSEITINQIAAGEVIESPSSVVKELCENSLDAGAKRIIVEVEGGGLHFLRITDDGCGMEQEDALLCLERHATSKIHEVKDLFRIQTMGFRGEALASIASISQLTLTTSIGEVGVRLEVDAGVVKSICPYPRNQGTTMEVRHLFFNVPARKKFQKSPSACQAESTKVITHLSLAYPDVVFEIHHNDTVVFRAEPPSHLDFLDQLTSRISSVLGTSFSQSVLQVDGVEGPFVIRGLIGAPDQTRHNRTGQYLFIHQRSIVSPAISFAIRDAFGTRISADRHPIYVLHIQMPPELLDVNVHPQKKEVRFTQESLIKNAVSKVVQRALNCSSVNIAPADVAVFDDFAFDVSQWDTKSQEPARWQTASFACRRTPELDIQTPVLPLIEQGIRVIGLWSQYLLVDSASLRSVVGAQEGLCLIDLKAAKARVLFEQFLKRSDTPVHSQGLFFSIGFEVPLFEMPSWLDNLETFQKIGFSINQSGPKSFLVDAIPSCVDESEVVEILKQMSDMTISLDKEENESLELKKMRSFVQVVCRFIQSSKGQVLMPEALSIMEQLLKTSSPLYCPQGHKIIASMSIQDVASYFTDKERGNAVQALKTARPSSKI